MKYEVLVLGQFFCISLYVLLAHVHHVCCFFLQIASFSSFEIYAEKSIILPCETIPTDNFGALHPSFFLAMIVDLYKYIYI